MKTAAAPRYLPRRRLALVALAAWGLALQASAIEIRADEAQADLSAGATIYRGNVRIEHESYHLEADEVTEYREDGELTRVIAVGSPARFRQDPVVDSTFTHGTARRIEYLAPAKQLRLTEYSVTDTKGNVQRGKQAVYSFE